MGSAVIKVLFTQVDGILISPSASYDALQIMNKFFPLLTFLAIVICSFSTLNAQQAVPFANCSDQAFAVLAPEYGVSNNEIATLFEVDINTMALTQIANLGVPMNGLAFNPNDEFLYGMNDTDTSGQPLLHRIDANGTVFPLTELAPPPGIQGGAVLSFAGEVNSNGEYLFPAVAVNSIFPAPSYTIYMGSANLAALNSPVHTPIYTQIFPDAVCANYLNIFVTQLLQYYNVPGSPAPSGGMQDWAISPIDGRLWSYMGDERVLFNMDIPSGVATCLQTANTTLEGFAGIFFNLAGSMRGMEVDMGRTYAIDNICPGSSCGQLAPLIPHVNDLRGDAASCVLPPMPPLAVSYQSFQAIATTDYTDIYWATATENQNQRFELEKSTDRRNWTQIETVLGAGTSTQINKYQSRDESPTSGYTYYRLRAIDMNGQASYSQTISAYLLETDGFKVYPNPIEDLMYIDFVDQQEAEQAAVRFYDAMGRVVQPRVNREFGRISADWSEMLPGVYNVSVSRPDGPARVEKVIVK